MVITRRFEEGSGLGTGGQNRPALSKDRIKGILQEEVVAHFWAQLIEMFGFIKATMMEYFDERYACNIPCIK